MEAFEDWYQRLHGYPPFPWQSCLASRVKSGKPPKEITAPTGAGKTAVIAVWLWAHDVGLQLPTRLFYVIDRRILVDSVSTYAESLCQKLEKPVQIVRLRGGQTADSCWLMDPVKPTILVSTVDQIGSRILFRGYGVSPQIASIHAGLAGNDSWIVLDEAHISSAFWSTMQQVSAHRQKEQQPLWLSAMTATPVAAGDSLLELTSEDYAHPILHQRLSASKQAQLVKSKSQTFVADVVSHARGLRADGYAVVGVICNTVRDARAVHQRLSKDNEAILLTGRIRQPEREKILDEYLPHIENGRRGKQQNNRKLYVVSTQTIEVGADLDFDALVTQSAPLDALRQRFGRVDRSGEQGLSKAVIVHKDLTADEDCPIYTKALLKSTFSWLGKAQQGKGKNKFIDFGIQAFGHVLSQQPEPPQRIPPQPPVLNERILRQLRQTLPAINVDIEPFLHGDQPDSHSAYLLWRNDLGENTDHWAEIASAVAPVMAETLSTSVWELKRWLGNRPCVVNGRLSQGGRIRAGDMVVAPCSWGGMDQWGWNPQSETEVEDIGNRYSKWVRLPGAAPEDDLKELLAQSNITRIEKPVGVPYKAGILVREANARVKQFAINLDDHLAACKTVARQLSDDPAVIEAAYKHDVGKADFRFQLKLGADSVPLAKSAQRGVQERELANRFCGLPDGWRHEINSADMLKEDVSFEVLYLIATHHGHARTYLPIAGDPELWKRLDGYKWAGRVANLNAEHGIWGLAYKEALVRLTDWIQSKKEQELARHAEAERTQG